MRTQEIEQWRFVIKPIAHFMVILIMLERRKLFDDGIKVVEKWYILSSLSLPNIESHITMLQLRSAHTRACSFFPKKHFWRMFYKCVFCIKTMKKGLGCP